MPFTSKDVFALLPKSILPGESINEFCKRIEHAWRFCESENYNEAKFCQILRLSLTQDAAEVFYNLPIEDQNTVNTVVQALLTQLDKQQQEYLREFSEITKSPHESYNDYCLRIKRLYKRGTGGTILTNSEKIMLTEMFLNGLPTPDSTALRLVASDEEMKDIEMLTRRAARTGLSKSKSVDDIFSYE